MYALNKLALFFALVGLVAVNALPHPGPQAQGAPAQGQQTQAQQGGQTQGQGQAQSQPQTQSTTNDPKPLASQPDCVNQCLVSAAPGNGCADTDLSCMCSSSPLQDVARQCIQTQCPGSGLKNADTLKAQLCQK
ncbi:hypothetical protein VKT23_016866 [Stygiomarasmius scandens]|uniref:CFEM domain-containing protein n=1 Tax=Marasmiellus scandens TaxID=2682957 RepID=A0ABR1IWP6_9AGAR